MTAAVGAAESLQPLDADEVGCSTDGLGAGTLSAVCQKRKTRKSLVIGRLMVSTISPSCSENAYDHMFDHNSDHSNNFISGCSLSVRHLVWDQGQAGSTPVTRTKKDIAFPILVHKVLERQ